MKVTVHFTDEAGTAWQENFFMRVTEETLKRCPFSSLHEKEEVILNAIVVPEEKIRELNKTYRGKDRATDILSFGEYSDSAEFEADTEKKVFLGELFFCHVIIAAAASEDAITVEHEMIYVFSHGVLHLLGYNHSDEMFAIQDAVTEHLMRKE